MILRCTKKLRDIIRPGNLADTPADDEDWYGNLLWIDGRKCLLLSHAGTLFTVFEPDVRAAGLRDTGRLVTGLIERELALEHLPPELFGELDPASVIVAKTASRSVLGFMTDMALAIEHALDLDGGLASVNVADLNQWLRRTLLNARGFRQPIELARQRAEAADSQRLRTRSPTSY